MGIILRIKTFILSFLIRNISYVNLHNLSKFLQIKKIWSNISLDDIKGDYIEFGIFKGKSLYHSVKTAKKLNLNNNIKFWGLDSFSGFPVENHNFYTKENFKSSQKKVEKDFLKFKNVNIISGFFDETINREPLASLDMVCFAFVDCDIYESADNAFMFLSNKMQKGGFIMIDDFTSIDKNGNYIAKSFFDNFSKREIILFDTYSNGQTFRIMN